MSLVHPVNTSWCLEKVCEANYQKLLQLIPDLTNYQRGAQGIAPEKPSLHLSILERSRHTLTIRLSHNFARNLDDFMLPAVVIRVYCDAKLVEVISDHAREAVYKVYQSADKTLEIMQYKWKLNYFLEKWLSHCLQARYQFSENIQDNLELA